MDEKQRFQKLRKKLKELGVEDLGDDKLDKYEQELKKYRTEQKQWDTAEKSGNAAQKIQR